MYEPVKVGFGRYLGRFFAGGIVPTTRYLTEYVKRPLHQAILWAPGRMVDLAEEMLAAWQRDDSRGAPTPAYSMPIMLAAMAKDATQSGPDYNRAIATEQPVVIPDDPKSRLFHLRTCSANIRTQVVIAAHEEPTARALASQFLLFCEAFPNRVFPATFRHSGINVDWPVKVMLPENPAALVSTEAKNLTLLACDLTLHATVPLYRAPKSGEPNDGQGDPENLEDLAGFPMVVEITNDSKATL